MEDIKSYSILSDVALGFIAFSIGNEFRLSSLKQTGKQASVIGIIQAVFTTLVVDAALIGVHFLMPDKLPLSTSMECWGLAVAVAERLAKTCGARVCPFYVENALGMAAGDLRVTVGVVKA
jgi:Kef-type K+ transport system membrane component KefB